MRAADAGQLGTKACSLKIVTANELIVIMQQQYSTVPVYQEYANIGIVPLAKSVVFLLANNLNTITSGVGTFEGGNWKLKLNGVRSD